MALTLCKICKCISYLTCSHLGSLLQLGWEITHPKMNYDIIHTCQSNIMKTNIGCYLVVTSMSKHRLLPTGLLHYEKYAIENIFPGLPTGKMVTELPW